MDAQVHNIHNELVTRLKAAQRKEFRAAVLRGLTLTFAVALVCILLASALEAILRMPVLPRSIVACAVLGLTVTVAVGKVLIPLLRYLGVLKGEKDEDFARRIGLRFPLVRDHLANLLQLYRERRDPRFYSLPLIDAAFDQSRSEMEGIDFSSAIDYSGVRRGSKLLLVAGVTALLLFGLFPGSFVSSSYRMLHFGTSFAAELPFHFIVDPGNKEVVKGESVPVVIRVVGQSRKQVLLLTRPAGQAKFEEQVLQPGPDGAFRSAFPSLKLSTTYAAQSGDIRSDDYTITVVERPVVKSLRVALAFPGYAGLPRKELDENVGDVTALKGTRASFRIEAGKALGDARLVFNDSTQKILHVSGPTATGEVTLMQDHTYHILLRDEEGRTNTDPIEYTIKMVPDAYPTAAILVPGANVDIAENGQVNLLIRITDDYGFSSLRLAHRLMQSRYEKAQEQYTFSPIPIPPDVRTEGNVAYLWSLGELHLAPEDVVSYYAEVFDNDRISGPKAGKSETYTLRLPSLEEVFADADKAHDVSLENVQEALKESQEAHRELEELQQELRKEQQKMTWQQQKKAEELASKYEQVQKKMDEVNKTVEQMVKDLQKNQVLSPETLEKYQELQRLMEELNTPEFAEAMKKLQQSMQQISPDALKQALQQFNFSEENFRKSIERTMNLLKRIQIEQKVDEMVKRAEELAKRQEELQKQTEQTNPSDKARADELSREQKELQQQLEQLEKALADLEQKMQEFPKEMPLAEMENTRKDLEDSQLQEQMDQIAGELQKQQLQQASQGQRQAMKSMGKMMQNLKQMKEAMQQNQQQQIVNEMRRAFQDLLELSKRQESLKNATAGLEPNSAGFRENAGEQMDVMSDLGKVTAGLSSLSQRTFGITPEMGKAIGDAMRQMDQSIQSLTQRNGNAASQQQGGAMASLNEAANMVQSAMNAMMQPGGQGMGMAGFMQRMQQLSGAQQGINQGTRNLGGMSPQQAAELGRLAAEQGMVRKSLEQLAREAAGAGELSKMLGDLNRVAQDMREVQTDLAQGNVNPETIKKQDRILSRLLDSQRSTRERDFEKRRKAETGKDILRAGPSSLDLTTQEGKTRLQRDLLKAMDEGYAKDYQELIRKYFEALEKSGVEGSESEPARP